VNCFPIKIYGSVIFSIVLRGCQTWSLTLREWVEGLREQGAEEDIWADEGGNKRRQHSGMICLQQILIGGGVGDMGGACDTCGGEKKCIMDFCKIPVRKEPFGRPRRRRKDNFKMDLREIGLEDRSSSGQSKVAGNETSGPVRLWELLR
jgi:hypothetical protein